MRKVILDTITKCYSLNALYADGQTKLIFAGEGDGSLQIYQGKDFRTKTTLWSENDGLGGTMTICTVPDREGYFFASTGFFTMIHSEKSSIYLLRYQHGAYSRVKICDIPYLHRFDVLTVQGHRYLVACTIHSGKRSPEDWSCPGKILVAELPMDLDGDVSVEPKVLMEGLTQNHGFNRMTEDGKEAVLIAAKNGIFKVSPPPKNSQEWCVEKLFDFSASDVCAADLDGDGILEYGVISPFHGNTFSVYKLVNGVPELLYRHQKPLDFYHAICADSYLGTPSFVIGARKLDMDLYRVFFDGNSRKIATELIESGAGSSNAKIIHTEYGDAIISANRQKDEAALFWP